jgi:hypothetical protein
MQTATINIDSVLASDLETDLRRARTLAVLLDSQFSIGPIRFGLDGIVGLVPVVGDGLTAVAACYPLYVAHKHDLGKEVIARMAVNVAVDFLAGSVSLIGDLVDVAFKANLKNLALLEKAAKARR